MFVDPLRRRKMNHPSEDPEIHVMFLEAIEQAQYKAPQPRFWAMMKFVRSVALITHP